MSALSHKADINARDCDVRFVPDSDLGRAVCEVRFALMNGYRRFEPGSIKDLAKLLKDFSQTVDVFLNDQLRLFRARRLSRFIRPRRGRFVILSLH